MGLVGDQNVSKNRSGPAAIHVRPLWLGSTEYGDSCAGGAGELCQQHPHRGAGKFRGLRQDHRPHFIPVCLRPDGVQLFPDVFAQYLQAPAGEQKVYPALDAAEGPP